jgi:hypothetical protein
MKAKFKNGLTERARALEAIPKQAWNDAFRVFKTITPKDTGYAKANTTKTAKSIIANYQYASYLDEGWSKQAPDGMTKPAIEEYNNSIAKQLSNLR